MVTPRKTPPPAKADEPLQFKITIPGTNATVTFWKPLELSPRRSREMEDLREYLSPLLRAAAIADGIDLEGDEEVVRTQMRNGNLRLSREDNKMFRELGDITAWTYLKSWTVKDGAEIRELPETWEDLLDLPRPIYNAIVQHAAKIGTSPGGGFDVTSVADPESPTEG
jgi:hypothetical protein